MGNMNQKIQELMNSKKPETIARGYIKYKNEAEDWKERYDEEKIKNYKRMKESEALERKIKRLENKIKYQNSLYNLKIEYLSVRCPYEDGERDCGVCFDNGGGIVTLVTKSMICHGFSIENFEGAEEWNCNVYFPKAGVLTYIDENYDENVEDVTMVECDGKVLYQAPQEIIDTIKNMIGDD